MQDKYNEIDELKIYIAQLEDENIRLKLSNKSLRTNNQGLIRGINKLNKKIFNLKNKINEVSS